MNGAGIELAAATAALLFINLRLLSFIGLLSLLVIRPYEPREHGANKKSPWTTAKAAACGLPCLCSPDSLVEASVLIFFERRSRSIPARRLPYCKNRTYAPVTLCQRGHRSRKLLIPLDFAPSRLHEADAGSAERSCFDAPHVRMAACTMHCFGSSRSSFAPSPVSFKVANDV